MTRYIAMILILSFLALPGPASAGASSGWLSLEGGISWYDMSDINAEIGNLNAFIAPNHLDEINNGLSLGISGGISLSKGTRVGVGYQRLYASSEADQGNIEYQLPANTFRALVELNKTTESQLEYGIGAGAGLLSLDGHVRPSLTEGRLEGSTFLADIHLFGGVPVGSWLVVTPSAGYRFADIGNVELDGTRITTFGRYLHADYTGPFAQLGFRVSLGH